MACTVKTFLFGIPSFLMEAAAVATKDGSGFCLATARMTSCAKDGSSLLAMATSAGTLRQHQ